MDANEELVWKRLVQLWIDNSALPSAAVLAEMCNVSADYAQSIIDRIGTPREVLEQETALQHQVGGNHYKDMGIQPWQAMEAWLTPEEYRGYHKGVAIAYLARERQKGGLDDIKKAIHHLQRLVEMADV